jgi:hypothetical protein
MRCLLKFNNNRHPSSLSDLGIVGCKSTAAVYFSPFSCPISRYWDAKTSKTILAGADFRFRRPKSDRLLAAPGGFCSPASDEIVGLKMKDFGLCFEYETPFLLSLISFI